MLGFPRDPRAWWAAVLLSFVPTGPVGATRAVDCGPNGLPAAALAPPALLGAADFSAIPCAEIVGGMAQFVLQAHGDGGADVEPASLRVESLERLSTCDPTDADAIRLHQAYIRVVDDIPLQLERYILAIRRDDMPTPV